MIRKVYEAQQCDVKRGDWVKIMDEEREKYGLLESDETISCMSQEKYRNLVKKKVLSHAVDYLHAVASPHSKSENLKNKKFQRQEYFSDRRFGKDDVQLLFKLRTKMLDCKANFRNQYNNVLTCRICKEDNSIEDEDHILNCSVLNDEEYDVHFSDVYGSADEQYSAVKVFKKVLRRRQVYLDIAERTAKTLPSV